MAWTEATSRSMPPSRIFLIGCPKVASRSPRAGSFHGACSPGHLRELPKPMFKKPISALFGINCRPMMRTIARERSSSLPSSHSWELLLVYLSWLLWNKSGISVVMDKMKGFFLYFSVIALVYLVFFASPERSREILDSVQATYHRALQQTHLEGSSWWNQIKNLWRN